MATNMFVLPGITRFVQFGMQNKRKTGAVLTYGDSFESQFCALNVQARNIWRKIGLCGGVAAILLSVLLPTAVAHAQSTTPRPPLNLMTSPLPLNVTTKPGVPVTADIRVKNNGTEPELLKVDLMKFGAQGDSGQPKLEEPQPQDLFMHWVHFSETTFTAQPNVWKTIQMTISPPKEAAFGYYYAVLFTRANPDKPTGGQSELEGGIASLVLLNVDAPGARREAQVVSLTASQKVYEFLPAHFTAKLHNSGNIHIIPTGTLFIRRGDTQVAAMDFNGERGNILPGTDRVFDETWKDGFPVFSEKTVDGKTVRGSLSWDFNNIQKFRFGKYTATLVAVYDDGQRDVPIEATVSFWVIPWRIIGGILLIILIILAGIWGIGRLFWRGIRRRAAAPVSDEPSPSSLAAAPRRNRGRPTKTAQPAPQQASPEVPKKRRGFRFRRKADTQTEEVPAAVAPRRGRPKKVVEPEPVARPTRGRPSKVVEPIPEVAAEPRRGRGRPPKVAEPEVPVRPGRGRPRKVIEAEVPARPTRGRPPKVVEPAVPEKPKRGRPPKVSVQQAEPPKRGRGRPPKSIEPAKTPRRSNRGGNR